MASLPRRNHTEIGCARSRTCRSRCPVLFRVGNKGPDRTKKSSGFRECLPVHRAAKKTIRRSHAEDGDSCLSHFCWVSACAVVAFRMGKSPLPRGSLDLQNWEKRYILRRRRAVPFHLLTEPVGFHFRKPLERSISRRVKGLVLLLASLLSIPLARQCCLDAALFTGLQIVGVTLDFLDDVLLLYLPLEPAQRIFQRFAFLYANLSQDLSPPNLLKSYLP